MLQLSLKQKIIAAVLIIGSFLILVFQRGIYKPISTANPTSSPKAEINQDKPVIVSTKPENLDNAIILPTQIIEITFNMPLENRGEFKNKLDPKLDYEIELSDDRKTARIIPKTTFSLGTTYTLFIYSNETKFDGGKKLDHDYTYHFKTIEYKGV